VAAAWAGLLVAACAPLIVVLAPDHTSRFAAMLLFVGLVPGCAVMCWLDIGDALSQTAVAIVISISCYAAATTILIWASAWHPDIVLFVLGAPAALSCLGRLLSARRSMQAVRRRSWPIT